MEMHQVRYFLAAAELLNFSRAAEKCEVSQPSLSRAIRALEIELGGPLFRREGRNSHLSDLGRMVHPHLEQVYAESLAAQRAAKDFSTFRKSLLKLGIMSTIAPDQIVDLIGAIRKKHAGIELALCDSDAKDLRARLLGGELEVTIDAFPGELDDRIHRVPLFREQMMIVIHPEHRLANQRAIRVKDIDGESYIHRNNCEFAGYADRVLHEQGVTCTPSYWSDRDDWTLAMIAAGLGFGFMPAHSVRHEGVRALPVVEPEFWREVNLVSVRGRPYSPAVGVLVREAMRKKWFGEPAIASRASGR